MEKMHISAIQHSKEDISRQTLKGRTGFALLTEIRKLEQCVNSVDSQQCYGQQCYSQQCWQSTGHSGLVWMKQLNNLRKVGDTCMYHIPSHIIVKQCHNIMVVVKKSCYDGIEFGQWLIRMKWWWWMMVKTVIFLFCPAMANDFKLYEVGRNGLCHCIGLMAFSILLPNPK